MSDTAPIPSSTVTLAGGAASPTVIRRARLWFRLLLAVLVLWFGVLAALWYTTVFRPRASAVTPPPVPAVPTLPASPGPGSP